MKHKWIPVVIVVIIALTCIGFYLLCNQESTKSIANFHPITPASKPITNKEPTKEEPTDEVEQVLGIPIQNKVNLTLEQSVQETNYFCVPACVQMVLRFHGLQVDQTTLAKEMNTSSITGTEYVDMARTLNQHLFNKGIAADNEIGYHVQTVAMNDQRTETMQTFEQRVRDDIQHQDPVFVTVNTHTLYPDLASANHMIVITGYALHENRDRIAVYYIIDPYTKVQDPTYGGYKVFTSEELYNALITNEEPAYLW